MEQQQHLDRHQSKLELVLGHLFLRAAQFQVDLGILKQLILLVDYLVGDIMLQDKLVMEHILHIPVLY